MLQLRVPWELEMERRVDHGGGGDLDLVDGTSV